MAGHSKFKNIMHRKGAQDKKRAKLFSRLIREISVAAKISGGDPDSNPRLRTAINNALSSNMSKDSIQKAIKKNTGNQDNEQIFEIIYVDLLFFKLLMVRGVFSGEGIFVLK